MLRTVLVPEFCSDQPVPRAVARIRPHRLSRLWSQQRELESGPSPSSVSPGHVFFGWGMGTVTRDPSKVYRNGA